MGNSTDDRLPEHTGINKGPFPGLPVPQRKAQARVSPGQVGTSACDATCRWATTGKYCAGRSQRRRPAHHVRVSGQVSGINTLAHTHSTRLSGMPRRAKSAKR